MWPRTEFVSKHTPLCVHANELTRRKSLKSRMCFWDNRDKTAECGRKNTADKCWFQSAVRLYFGPFAFEQKCKPANAENRGRQLKLALIAQQLNAPVTEITVYTKCIQKNTEWSQNSKNFLLFISILSTCWLPFSSWLIYLFFLHSFYFCSGFCFDPFFVHPLPLCSSFFSLWSFHFPLCYWFFFSRLFLHLDPFPFPTLPGTTEAPAKLAGFLWRVGAKAKSKRGNVEGGRRGPISGTVGVMLAPVELKSSRPRNSPQNHFRL